MPAAGAFAVFVISRHELEPFFPFENLTDVMLVSPVGFDLDDTTAWNMARAWPRLTRLVLEPTIDSSLHCHPSNMTLHGLRAFATHCRELERLTITFDALTVPPLDNAQDTANSKCTLSFLCVGTSPICDAPTVARFLLGLFPHLESINSAHHFWDQETNDDDETTAARVYEALWRDVAAMVSMPH
ncbi:hypothetical protein B0H11DRAFT_2143032 [Mycena galericulata]|nr:hypothetical protein B0H11DRAFT_2143032 [Mycena galericulata]